MIRGFEARQDNLNNLYDQGAINQEEYIQLTRQIYSDYKKDREEFAKVRFGQNWHAKLQELQALEEKLKNAS